jgi:hypothetical protein
VQYAEKSDLCTKVLGIGRDFKKRLSRCLKQESEQKLLILPNQWNQTMWNAKDKVIVIHWQQLFVPFAQPLLPRIGLALWAVAIPTRVVRDGLVATTLAFITMPA